MTLFFFFLLSNLPNDPARHGTDDYGLLECPGEMATRPTALPGELLIRLSSLGSNLVRLEHLPIDTGLAHLTLYR